MYKHVSCVLKVDHTSVVLQLPVNNVYRNYDTVYVITLQRYNIKMKQNAHLVKTQLSCILLVLATSFGLGRPSAVQNISIKP
jgi:hypothetical protein